MTYEEFAKQLALDAGVEIKKNFQINGDRDWKEDGTPVTATDLAINKMVIKRVAAVFPEHGVKGEEESAMTGNEEYLWVCDPIDGTIPFAHGIPTCVFSIALVQGGEPILGVVHDPLQDRLFFAEKGKGTFLNDHQIHVSKLAAFNADLILASTLSIGPRVDLLAVVREFKKRKVHVLNLACHIYAGVLVAAGELGAAIYKGKGAHDGAALKILVEEAGGRVTDLFGDEQRYDGELKGQLVSNGVLHDQILDLIREFGILNED